MNRLMALVAWFALFSPPAFAGLEISDLGKTYTCDCRVTPAWLQNHIERDEDVVGGNTSLRNETVDSLDWKGSPNANGYGYYQRNRDLGQVINLPVGKDVKIDAIVLRTGRGNNAIMAGTPGAKMYVQFFEVIGIPGETLRINENGTTKSQRATHGFDTKYNRADDFVQGVEYVPVARITGGVFPPGAPPTTQYAYRHRSGEPFGVQPGHLRYFRFDLTGDDEIVLRGGKRYVFMVGFDEPGRDRGLGIAITTKVHKLDAAEFDRDSNGAIRWAVRREGDGTLPPATIDAADPPADPKLRNKLIRESTFPADHWNTLRPTSEGYPDVDTYMTRQFYIETKPLLLGQSDNDAAAGKKRAVSLIDGRIYEAVRARIRSHDTAIQPSVDWLRRRAEQTCRTPATAVTDKRFTRHSPSRDPHDYVSIATYWWPNPESADGLPYTSRDGQLTPDFKLYDRPRWEIAADSIVTLAKAAYFLDEPRFGKEAVARVRRWFLDRETRMNPHLRYGQMIPGRCTGRQYGVIDFSLYLPAVLDHIRLCAELDESTWTASDQEAMIRWCDDFLTWLENHEFGQREEAATNNHAVYYDRTVVCLALFLNRTQRARTQLEKTRKRILQQINPDGSMPRELRRTCSFGYTVMNTRGFVELASVGRAVDVALWDYAGSDGQSIPAAVDFLYRHACSTEPWPHKQIEPIDWRMIWPVLTRAGTLSGEPYDFTEVAHRMPEGFCPDAFPLVEPIHPFGKTRSPVVDPGQ